MRQQEVLRRAEAGRRIARFSASVRPEEGDDPQRAELILLAAARLFAERGYEVSGGARFDASAGARATEETLIVARTCVGWKRVNAAEPKRARMSPNRPNSR